ncbi:hypothetical protein BJ508DRAFT_47866 [Ascobolus immersus RN42]|uniref:Uncharacterized protein n=1 Tax=Ascobolus immersus RN42 TaxID=1160509 RepID=A0A3N4HMA2_ASCIM|nr:hypothetical protein BJ508DRAFT_47866 [Ascobolus immersus RN42]
MSVLDRAIVQCLVSHALIVNTITSRTPLDPVPESRSSAFALFELAPHNMSSNLPHQLRFFALSHSQTSLLTEAQAISIRESLIDLHSHILATGDDMDEGSNRDSTSDSSRIELIIDLLRDRLPNKGEYGGEDLTKAIDWLAQLREATAGHGVTSGTKKKESIPLGKRWRRRHSNMRRFRTVALGEIDSLGDDFQAVDYASSEASSSIRSVQSTSSDPISRPFVSKRGRSESTCSEPVKSQPQLHTQMRCTSNHESRQQSHFQQTNNRHQTPSMQQTLAFHIPKDWDQTFIKNNSSAGRMTASLPSPHYSSTELYQIPSDPWDDIPYSPSEEFDSAEDQQETNYQTVVSDFERVPAREAVPLPQLCRRRGSESLRRNQANPEPTYEPAVPTRIPSVRPVSALNFDIAAWMQKLSVSKTESREGLGFHSGLAGTGLAWREDFIIGE